MFGHLPDYHLFVMSTPPTLKICFILIFYYTFSLAFALNKLFDKYWPKISGQKMLTQTTLVNLLLSMDEKKHVNFSEAERANRKTPDWLGESTLETYVRYFVTRIFDVT